MTAIGRAANRHELIALIRRRQAELGMSNADIDDRCGFTTGHYDKMYGPSAVRGINLDSHLAVMDVLGLSQVLEIDPSKQVAPGTRQAVYVRPQSRLSKAVIKKARPVVMSEWGLAANKARWDRVPKAKRREIARQLAQFRWKRASEDA